MEPGVSPQFVNCDAIRVAKEILASAMPWPIWIGHQASSTKESLGTGAHGEDPKFGVEDVGRFRLASANSIWSSPSRRCCRYWRNGAHVSYQQPHGARPFSEKGRAIYNYPICVQNMKRIIYQSI